MANVIQQLDEILRDPNQLSPENMERLVQETFSFFNDLKSKLESTDGKVREEALNAAASLKDKLEEQAQILCESVGMSPETLENYINDSSHFNEEEWNAIQKTKEDISHFQDELSLTKIERKEKKPKPKIVKEWIVG